MVTQEELNMSDLQNPENQTRLSVIMFSDIVGYSKMMQENENLAMTILGRHNEFIREALGKHDGKEIKVIGDAFLVSFATVANAVRCAIDIQEKFSKYNESAAEKERLLLRIGIHMGDIIVKDNDVFGDGVNIASRIQPLAEPGGICISQEVYNLVKHKLDMQAVSLGPKELKNIKDKIEIYEILVGSIATSSHMTQLSRKSQIRKVVSNPLAIGITSVCLVAIVWMIVSVFLKDNALKYESLDIKRLTNSDDILVAALSPDGQYVAYSTRVPRGGNVYLKHVPSASTTKLWQADSGSYYASSNLTFSPDGNYLYFSFEASLCRLARLGGEPRIIVRGYVIDFAISPDGKRLAINKDQELVTMNEDGSDVRRIGPRATEKYESRYIVAGRPWSPDGRLIVLEGYRREGRGLIIHNLIDSTETEILNPLWNYLDNVVWAADGKSLLVTGERTDGDKSQIWRVSYPQGEVRQITFDANGFRRLSASADDKSLAAVQSTSTYSLWVLHSGDEFNIQKVSTGEQEIQGWMRWTADNRILFETSKAGENNLKGVYPDGSKLTTLYSDTIDFTFRLAVGTDARVKIVFPSPQISRDTRFFYFESHGYGGSNIWKVDLQSGSRKSVYHDTSYLNVELLGLALAADDEWLYVIQDRRLVKVRSDGKQVDSSFSKLDINELRLSPDGSRLACSRNNYERHGDETVIFDVKLRNVLQTLPISSSVEWTRDGKGLCYLITTNGVPNIWMQSLAGGKPKQVTHFPSDYISDYGWSSDGKYFAVVRQSKPSDIYLLTVKK
jgi:class 3 adenylate cyclase/Tol biopolymer transport system component